MQSHHIQENLTLSNVKTRSAYNIIFCPNRHYLPMIKSLTEVEVHRELENPVKEGKREHDAEERANWALEHRAGILVVGEVQ